MIGPCAGIATTALILLTLAVPAASPATDGSPTPAEIAALRDRVDHHVARVRLGRDLYDIRGARFDSVGVAFDSHRLRPRSAVAYYEQRPPRPSSPIAWDRIDRITVRKPCGLRGAIAGGVMGTAVLTGVAVWWNVSNVEPGPAFFVFAFPPVGATIGGAIGALTWRSEPGWQRGGGTRAGAAGSIVRSQAPAAAGGTSPHPSAAAVAQAPPSLPLGVLRDDIGRHEIRLRVGGDLYEIRDARLEPSGIAFDAGRLRTLSSGASAGARDRGGRASPASSPIGWDRIDRVEARMPSTLRGAIWGMALLPTVLLAVRALEGADITDFGALGGAAAAGVPIGAFVGGGVGAFVHHSKLEWDRSMSAPPGR